MLEHAHFVGKANWQEPLATCHGFLCREPHKASPGWALRAVPNWYDGGAARTCDGTEDFCSHECWNCVCVCVICRPSWLCSPFINHSPESWLPPMVTSQSILRFPARTLDLVLASLGNWISWDSESPTQSPQEWRSHVPQGSTFGLATGGRWGPTSLTKWALEVREAWNSPHEFGRVAAMTRPLHLAICYSQLKTLNHPS